MLDPNISHIYNIILSLICGLFIFLAILPLINKNPNIIINRKDIH